MLILINGYSRKRISAFTKNNNTGNKIKWDTILIRNSTVQN
jgi:hypothetical protein